MAVRAEYKHLRISVIVSESRSKAMNKKIAKERLLKQINIKNMAVQNEQDQKDWNNHNSLERGNPVRIYKDEEFIRIDDVAP